MNILTSVFFGLVGFGLACLVIPLIIKYFAAVTQGRRQLHHTHTVPVSRLGGVALVLGFWAVAAIVFFHFPTTPERWRMRWVILSTATAMFTLGFIDDLWPLGAKKKLLGQILIAFAAWYGGIEITEFTNIFNGGGFAAGLWSAPLTILWLVALTNLINLIDGIDGLAGGVALMLMFLLAYTGWRNDLAFPTLCAIGMCGGLLGFLKFNFPPARIYLGDGGAYFLGFLIGLLSVISSQKGSVTAALIAPACALALPIIDVTLAILRRGSKGLPIFRPDRKHIHHRLQEAGLSRRRTVLFLYGISLLFLAAAFSLFLLQQRWLPLIIGGLCLILLLVARSFDFSREWFSVGKAWGNSLELRKDTQYALLFCRWMELEAERAESVESLWSDFKLITRKVGFSRVELQINSAVYCWDTMTQPGVTDEVREYRQKIPQFPDMALNFFAHSAVMPPHKFELMCDLMAEAWVKSISKWQEIHSQPITLPGETMISAKPALPKTPRSAQAH